MPYSYWIDVEREVVFSRIWGTLTDEQVAAHAVGLKADPRFDAELNQILDLRELTDLRVTNAGIRKVAHLVPSRRPARVRRRHRASRGPVEHPFHLHRCGGRPVHALSNSRACDGMGRPRS